MQLEIKIPASFQSQLISSDSRKMSFHYCLERLQKKDADSLMKIFDLILSTAPEARPETSADDFGKSSDLEFFLLVCDRLASFAASNEESRRFAFRMIDWLASKVTSKSLWIHSALRHYLTLAHSVIPSVELNQHIASITSAGPVKDSAIVEMYQSLFALIAPRILDEKKEDMERFLSLS